MPPKRQASSSSKSKAAAVPKGDENSPFLPEILVRIFSHFSYGNLCNLQRVSKHWKEVIQSPLLSHKTFLLPPKGSPLIKTSITSATLSSFTLHPIFNQLSYACGPYESFSVYNRYNRRRNRGGDEEDNEEEEVKDSWDITDEELKNVLGESATWPPVQELGGGWSKYSDDIVKCGSAKKAKGGVTVEQVLKSVGGYFGKMPSRHLENVMGDHIFAERWRLKCDAEKDKGYVVIVSWGS